MIGVSILQFARAFVRAFRRRDSFRHHVSAGEICSKRFAAPELFSHAPIAAVLAEAGGDQIAGAAQSIKGPRVSAHGGAEPQQLRQRPGDERRLRIVAQPEAVARRPPRSRKHSSTRRPARCRSFRRSNKCGSVRCPDSRCSSSAHSRIAAAENGGGGQIARNFHGQIRTGENGDGVVRENLVAGSGSSACRCRVRFPWCRSEGPLSEFESAARSCLATDRKAIEGVTKTIRSALGAIARCRS